MKVMFSILLIAIMGLSAHSQPLGYGFGKQFEILASEVSGSTPLADFPVLVSIIDLDLRSTINGGNVESADGFDIVFSLGDCITMLSHDLENYNAITGELQVWVQIPLLDNAAPTYFHMYYGNSSISTNQSTTDIWTDSNYDGVWHFHNDFLDASGSGNNGVNNGSTDISSAFIADGQSFNDPNNWVELPNQANRTGAFSYSAWVRTLTNNASGQRIICDDESNGNGCHALSIGDPGAGRLRFYIRGLGPVSLDTPAGLISNNTWHHIVGTYNGSNLKSVYIDGVLVASQTVTGVLGPATGNASIGGEVAAGETANRFNGDLDEVRANTGLLSADWVTTEYNNQSSPATFYNISAEFTATNLCLVLPVELLYFNATVQNNQSVLLDWETASERNNDYFTIERSRDGINWSGIGEIFGQGTSNAAKKYKFIDTSPFSGISYYRLKQTDFDGTYDITKANSVELIPNKTQLEIYPNPSKNDILISLQNLNVNTLEITNTLGQNVTELTYIISANSHSVHLNINALKSGAYIIKCNELNAKFIKQ